MESCKGPEKNWNDLPEELKRACIKKMDFLTTMNLRGASRADKQLVESSKLQIFRLWLGNYRSKQLFVGANVRFFMDFEDGANPSACAMLEFLLQHGHVDNFETVDIGSRPCRTPKLIETIAGIRTTRPFRVKNVNIEPFYKDYLPFLNNCTGLKELELLCARCDGITLGKFLPAITHLETVELRDVIYLGAHYYIQLIEEVVDAFEERVVGHGRNNREHFIRLKMDDPKKHIMVELVHESSLILIRVVEDEYKYELSDDSEHSDNSEDSEEEEDGNHMDAMQEAIQRMLRQMF